MPYPTLLTNCSVPEFYANREKLDTPFILSNSSDEHSFAQLISALIIEYDIEECYSSKHKLV
ncbi:hypothetical protein T4B_5054 [Trichinella pseudospiralis]|uniref:Uncharacterized protein n=2 Tax=Trichinella pseudospiralis TaxID=6337 RepID=A0A0V1IIP1_TRIPS|nr:hypothetical protein T4A_11542 [Trichinella pseudospiralis]KRY67200.1 hypothetical protein T4A_6350 [Trichinella pseudospiralis]KRY86481.1 hypothetical protein T4D_11825 [Trichinella pseudospiralis]KRZ00943.1 hypothetical protein T4B_7750 [Trichinella pseudospiralis]KRZ01008.1 hypothetical protein T4B_6785 [Trichinella pseudospiralis]